MTSSSELALDTAALNKAGLRLVGGQLLASRRTYPLDARVEIDAEVRRPPWRLALAVVVLSIGILPFAVFADSLSSRDLSWLVVVPMSGLFGAVVSMLSMNDRYSVILRNPAGAHCLYSSDDHQLVLYLVAALRQAVRGGP